MEQEIQDRIEEIEHPYVVGDLNAQFTSQNAVRDFMEECLVFAKEGDARLRQLEKRQRIISEIVSETPCDLMTVIKEVYVFERWSIEREGSSVLFKSKEAVYKEVREWFDNFEDKFY